MYGKVGNKGIMSSSSCKTKIVAKRRPIFISGDQITYLPKMGVPEKHLGEFKEPNFTFQIKYSLLHFASILSAGTVQPNVIYFSHSPLHLVLTRFRINSEY